MPKVAWEPIRRFETEVGIEPTLGIRRLALRANRVCSPAHYHSVHSVVLLRTPKGAQGNLSALVSLQPKPLPHCV